jgi:hypothetical protein
MSQKAHEKSVASRLSSNPTLSARKSLNISYLVLGGPVQITAEMLSHTACENMSLYRDLYHCLYHRSVPPVAGGNGNHGKGDQFSI